MLKEKPEPLSKRLRHLTCSNLIMPISVHLALLEAADRIDDLESKTRAQIGFTYEPTGERANIFAPSIRDFEIFGMAPEVLSLDTNSRIGDGEAPKSKQPSINIRDFVDRLMGRK